MLDDILLDVMGCLDYGSLVVLSMSSASMFELTTRFEDQLACRQFLQLFIDDTVALRNRGPPHMHRRFIDHIADEDLDEVTEAERVNAANEAILREVGAHVRLFDIVHVEFKTPSLRWAQLTWAKLVNLIPTVGHARSVYYSRRHDDHHVATRSSILNDIEHITNLESIRLDNVPFAVVASLLRHEQARRVACFRATIEFDAERIESLGTDVTAAICDVSLLEEDEAKYVALEGPFGWRVVVELIQAIACAPRRISARISSRLFGRPIRSDDYFAFANPLPLRPEEFEEKCVLIAPTLYTLRNSEGAARLKLAYVSANVTVFSTVFRGVTVTNSPKCADEESRYSSF